MTQIYWNKLENPVKLDDQTQAALTGFSNTLSDITKALDSGEQVLKQLDKLLLANGSVLLSSLNAIFEQIISVIDEPFKDGLYYTDMLPYPEHGAEFFNLNDINSTAQTEEDGIGFFYLTKKNIWKAFPKSFLDKWNVDRPQFLTNDTSGGIIIVAATGNPPFTIDKIKTMIAAIANIITLFKLLFSSKKYDKLLAEFNILQAALEDATKVKYIISFSNDYIEQTNLSFKKDDIVYEYDKGNSTNPLPRKVGKIIEIDNQTKAITVAIDRPEAVSEITVPKKRLWYGNVSSQTPAYVAMRAATTKYITLDSINIIVEAESVALANIKTKNGTAKAPIWHKSTLIDLLPPDLKATLNGTKATINSLQLLTTGLTTTAITDAKILITEKKKLLKSLSTQIINLNKIIADINSVGKLGINAGGLYYVYVPVQKDGVNILLKAFKDNKFQDPKTNQITKAVNEEASYCVLFSIIGGAGPGFKTLINILGIK